MLFVAICCTLVENPCSLVTARRGTFFGRFRFRFRFWSSSQTQCLRYAFDIRASECCSRGFNFGDRRTRMFLDFCRCSSSSRRWIVIGVIPVRLGSGVRTRHGCWNGQSIPWVFFGDKLFVALVAQFSQVSQRGTRRRPGAKPCPW